MPWPSARFKTAAPGGTWTPDDMNGWQDQFIRPDGLVADDLSSALAGQLGVNQTGIARRGYAEHLAEQTSPSVTMPVVTLGAAAAMYLVYYEFDLRASSVSSATINVIDGSANVLATSTKTGLSAAYSVTRPSSFVVVTIAPASNRISLGVSVSSGTYSVQNAKLWVISQNF